MDSRMLSALITGVRRAFPYVAPEEVEPLIEAHAGRKCRKCFFCIRSPYPHFP
jgi:ribosome biogenesis protein MAK21